MRMIDADALIAETMKNRCADCDRRKGIKQGKITFVYDFGEAPCRACDVGDMIDILDEAPTVGDWISVKDRLPENNAVCLTYSPKGKMRVAEVFLPSSIQNSKYDPMECWWHTHGSGGMRFVAVTHWMPLPEPPKEAFNNG